MRARDKLGIEHVCDVGGSMHKQPDKSNGMQRCR